MIIPIELRFKADKDTRLAVSTNKTIKSHDVNSVEFHIAIEGLKLTNNHTAKILSIFHSSKSQVHTDCKIVDGKIIYKPDTKLISMYETVTNYVYVYYNDKSVDVCEFNYTVKLSKIDETSLEVKTVYDKSYADLLANFEQALSEYKDSLPQADSVRADIDEILNQFSEDGETALSDFRQQADTDVELKLTEIQNDANQLFSSAINQFKQDGANEIADWRASADSELEETLSDRVIIRNRLENGDFSDSTRLWGTALGNLEMQSDIAAFTPTAKFSRVIQNQSFQPNNRYYHAMRVKASGSTPHIYTTSPVNKSPTITGNGDWETVSVIHTPSVTNTEIRYVFDGAIGAPIQIDWIMKLNLTEIFGAGNEPSKAEMDELIKITGYFDEITLTQKQMLTWHLNLMRQNRNALIALGGTII